MNNDSTYGETFSISFDLPDRLIGYINQFEEEIRKATQEIVLNVTKLLEIEWKQEATNSLKSVEKYNNSFSRKEISPYHIVLENNHPAVIFLEAGTCVLYSPRSDKHLQPKIYTENGWIPCSLIKEGDYVLNKNGKFTKVLMVHNNDLYTGIWLRVIKKISRKLYDGYEREWCLVECPSCGYREEGFKINYSRKRCPLCSKKKKVVKIEVCRGKRSAYPQSLYLTEDHLVLTSKGYKKAIELKLTDKIALFLDKECDLCHKPFVSFNRFCSRTCAARASNILMLKNGKHATQQNPQRAKLQCIKNRLKAKKNSLLEEAFYQYFSPYGYKIKRQYPVKVKKNNGIFSFYILDFYLPKYKLGIELDGTSFHNKERDEIRDNYILKQAGINIIRITDKEWRKNYKNCIRRVIRRISNHENLFSIDYKRVKNIKSFVPYNGFALTTKFDLTVEEGSSFVCQNVVIHNSGFDMKRMLDTSSHVKVSKDGKRYIRIPFEGKVKDYIAGGIDKDEIRAMAGSNFVTIKYGEREKRLITRYGDRLTDLGNTGVKRKYFTVLNATSSKFPNKTNSPNMGNPFTEYRAATTVNYTWKSSPYENAVKMVDFQGKTVGMKTFRTISDNSDPNSWIHPGIHASHIAEKAVEAVRPQLTAEMAKVLEPLYNQFEQSMNQAGFD